MTKQDNGCDHRYFSNSAYRPSSVLSGHYDRLSPFQKAALTTNGTLTLLLEAFFDEPIVAKTVAFHHECADDVAHSLRAVDGERMITRQVHLIGEESGLIHVAAHSVLAIDRLPVGFEPLLAREKSGIGHVIQRLKLETYRDLQWWGVYNHKINDEIRLSPCRLYKIIFNKIEIASIFEIFMF